MSSELKWYCRKVLASAGYGSCDVYWDADGAPERWMGRIDDASLLLQRLGFNPESRLSVGISWRKARKRPSVHTASLHRSCAKEHGAILADVRALAGRLKQGRLNYRSSTLDDGVPFLVTFYQRKHLTVEVSKRECQQPGLRERFDPVERFLLVDRLVSREVEVFDLLVKVSRGDTTIVLRLYNIEDVPGGKRWRAAALKCLNGMDEHRRQSLRDADLD